MRHGIVPFFEADNNLVNHLVGIIRNLDCELPLNDKQQQTMRRIYTGNPDDLRTQGELKRIHIQEEIARRQGAEVSGRSKELGYPTVKDIHSEG